ncbi:type II toxin-antitoxin system VapC family toxin [Microbacterium resistens]|uniref:type II toxin-antitoxin system VapC family toxin n=1 Tax=Microbacterium resistens TaxID=156977 RepID=UPI0008302EF1|nr:type II toxin-antitoxin system VapC family toxin [Microbacterium resistens]
MIYVDTSAVLKAVIAEEGSDRVRALFAEGVPLVSSRLLEVELHAASQRSGVPRERVEALVDRIALIALDDEVVEHAVSAASGLRSLDALHLATALLVAEDLEGFLTFDDELGRAAAARGLRRA